MRRSFLQALTIAGVLAMVTPVFADNSQQVDFLNWADYISPQIIPDFQKQTGIEVNQSFFDGSDMLRAKLMAGGLGYDLTVPDLTDMTQEIPAGVLQPIDKTKLPNWQYRDKAVYKIAAQIDPDNRYGVIYMYGTTGVAYNPDLIRKVLGPDAPVNDWRIVLDPKYLSKLQSCGVGFVDNPLQMFGIVMHYLGLNPNSDNPADFEKAAAYLMTIRQYLLYFDNNRYITDLAAGNLCIAIGYSGDVIRAKANAQRMHAKIKVDYALPKGGAPIWFDMLVIPKGAPHLDATLAFINYLLDPKVSAENSNYLYQPAAVSDAAQYFNPLLKAPGLVPDQSNINELFNTRLPPPELNALETKLWMQVKYGIY